MKIAGVRTQADSAADRLSRHAIFSVGFLGSALTNRTINKNGGALALKSKTADW
jgi:hypothetical protein